MTLISASEEMDNDDEPEPVELVGHEEITTRTNPAHKLQSFDECREAIDDLYQIALNASGAAGFQGFLDFAARFSHMAVFNAMMVRVQRPGSVLAATRSQWESIGRWPLPDAVPIVTLRPFGPLNFVYDLDDTSGPEMPVGSPNPFSAVGSATAQDLKKCAKAAESFGVLVDVTNQYGSALAGTAAGFSLRPQAIRDGRFWWRVRVNARHEPAVQIATLAHELGHVYCGHTGAHPKGHWPDRSGLSHAHVELEAEAVAWLVCKRRGITPNSPEYLSSLVAQVDLKSISMWAIYAAANRVETRTSGRSR